MDIQTRERTTNQRTKILDLLRQSGSNGVTNVELSKIALRYNARLQELYERGFGVDVITLKHGITRYILTSEPLAEQKKLDSALDVVIHKINTYFDGSVNVGDLVKLLDENGLTVRRKNGYFKS